MIKFKLITLKKIVAFFSKKKINNTANSALVVMHAYLRNFHLLTPAMAQKYMLYSSCDGEELRCQGFF